MNLYHLVVICLLMKFKIYNSFNKKKAFNIFSIVPDKPIVLGIVLFIELTTHLSSLPFADR